jgi:hypothetical protein
VGSKKNLHTGEKSSHWRFTIMIKISQDGKKMTAPIGLKKSANKRK